VGTTAVVTDLTASECIAASRPTAGATYAGMPADVTGVGDRKSLMPCVTPAAMSDSSMSESSPASTSHDTAL
jgi:hypothetical protein